MKIPISKRLIIRLILTLSIVIAFITLQLFSRTIKKVSEDIGSSKITRPAGDSCRHINITTCSAILSRLGGPILILSSASKPFSRYYAEILRTEGFNEFVECDISTLSSKLLSSHDLAILGEAPLTASQVTILSDWVKRGGHLIAMRPDRKLAGLLGLSPRSSTISDAYLSIDTSSGPGAGIVKGTIQFHGAADVYGLNGASAVAVLCSDAKTKTSGPAVTLNSVGANGGQAAAFVYDLARSVVYTRQGNPAWAGRERDGYPPIRSDDLFCGKPGLPAGSGWLDMNKVAIPQADEQQRLLANLIVRMNLEKRPLPRFWYFPRSLKAVVVMTGDDHGNGGTAGRFDSYIAKSKPGCSEDNWDCIRSTSYIFPDTPMSEEQASSYNAAGFEIALHVNTDCSDWTPTSLASDFSDQLRDWNENFSSLPLPVTNRTHCVAWSDYATEPMIELANKVRLDTSYYYWPSKWVGNRPGFFTGSGLPMRFADSGGNIIDVYQAATQMTDESGQTYPFTIDSLLDRAIGPDGFYGAFVANMHTDEAKSSASDAIVRSAIKRGVPIISARQLLKWLDARNASAFTSLCWNRNSNTLDFSVKADREAKGLTAMVPVANGYKVEGISYNGNAVSFTTAAIKGIKYALFHALSGAYQVRCVPTSSASGPARFSRYRAQRPSGS